MQACCGVMAVEMPAGGNTSQWLAGGMAGINGG
jgi:hypothetical protein